MKAAHPRLSHARPRFLENAGRRLFALDIVPVLPCRGAVLYLAPYAEEMNRCRSHVAEQARALAAQGWRCLILDHYGTGESDGAIEDADWDRWLDDAAWAANWLRQDSGVPLTLWGLRTGALLAAEIASQRRAEVDRLLFWQPVLDGQQFLNQHLRLRIATQIVHAEARETTDSIRKRLAAGETIEIAGYPLSQRLAEGLAARRLAGMAETAGAALPRTIWIEVAGRPDQGLSPASQRVVDGIRAAGAAVDVGVAVGPLIWQLQVREDAPQLIEVTTRSMMGAAN